MVVGVTDGFRKNLEIHGVGYRAAMDGKTLVLNVGYSHPVRMTPPEGITFAVDGTDADRRVGIDKQLVGEEAARFAACARPNRTRARAFGTKARRSAARPARPARRQVAEY